jgi:hypothetical protein
MRPVRRTGNLTIFMCRLSWNLGASTFWNPQGLSRHVMGLLYLLYTRFGTWLKCKCEVLESSFQGKPKYSSHFVHEISFASDGASGRLTQGGGLLNRSTTVSILQLEWNGRRAETRFRLCVKWTSSCNSAGVRIQSTTGSRGVRVNR